MKRVSIGLVIGFLFATVWAGSFANKSASSGHAVYSILPSCRAAMSDTIGPIGMNYAKYFSLAFAGNRLTGKDTAIVDSGFFVRIYMGHVNSKTNLKTPLTADSIVQFWGDDTTDLRANPVIKDLTLPNAPYVNFVITRFDSNTDTLDWKTTAGVRDSSAMEFTITYEK